MLTLTMMVADTSSFAVLMAYAVLLQAESLSGKLRRCAMFTELLTKGGDLVVPGSCTKTLGAP